MSFDDESAARELDLYAENESALYGQFKSIIENVKRKISSGRYDASKAPKLWGYWYAEAAKRYVREFGGDVRTMFPASMRSQLAKERAKDEYEKIKSGEYGSVAGGAATATKRVAKRVKRSSARRHGVKRTKNKRRAALRHHLMQRRLHRSRARKRAHTRVGVGDRVSWISRPWGMRVHGLVTAVSGKQLTVQQSNGPIGTVDASDVLTVQKREMLK